MKTTTTLLCLVCLALIAGATFANITPDPREGKMGASSPLALPDYSPLASTTAQAVTCGPSLGSCSSLTLGFCDCDVPIPDFSCSKNVDIQKQVYTCYNGAILCGVGPKCTV